VSDSRPRTRLLGVDYGTVRVGLAVSDADRVIASPLEIRERQGDARDAEFFRQLVEREHIGGIVVGLPLHTTGREGVKAREARDLGDWLRAVTALPLVFADERFSTTFAESALWDAGLTHKKRKKRRDAVAAQIMLQAFLDAGCPPDVPVKRLDE
jgi:putative pre-16S rRNA nuclease